MREILFRGQSIDRRKWYEGDLYQTRLKSVFYINYYTEHGDRMAVEIDPETVGQYTGLTDKNGKKIFEVDIVKIYLYEPKGLANYEIGCIKFDDTKARFVFCTKDGSYSIDNTNTYEIIGNIYDNPELLKGGVE